MKPVNHRCVGDNLLLLYIFFSLLCRDSWFDISDLIDCNQEGILTPCFGCCFNYNPKPSCPGCTRDAAIVLSCSENYCIPFYVYLLTSLCHFLAYDLFKGHGSVSGNRKLCELNSNNKINDASSTCNRQAGINDYL